MIYLIQTKGGGFDFSETQNIISFKKLKDAKEFVSDFTKWRNSVQSILLNTRKPWSTLLSEFPPPIFDFYKGYNTEYINHLEFKMWIKKISFIEKYKEE